MRSIKTIFCGLSGLFMVSACSAPEMPKTCVIDLKEGRVSIMQMQRGLGHYYYRMSAPITSFNSHGTYIGTGGYKVPMGGGSSFKMRPGEDLIINPKNGYCSATTYIGDNDIGFVTEAVRADVEVILAERPKVKGKGRAPY